MFNWLNAKKSEKTGVELANLVEESGLNDRSLNESKRQSKLNYVKQKMQKRLRLFKQEETLNVYKIAKLLNTFKWELKDAGFDDETAGALASWIHITLRES